MEVREGIAIGGFAEYVVGCWTVLEQDVKYVTEEIAALFMSMIQTAHLLLFAKVGMPNLRRWCRVLVVNGRHGRGDGC